MFMSLARAFVKKKNEIIIALHYVAVIILSQIANLFFTSLLITEILFSLACNLAKPQNPAQHMLVLSYYIMTDHMMHSYDIILHHYRLGLSSIIILAIYRDTLKVSVS